MIDVRELQRRGVVRIPKNDVEIPTNSEGFIELGKSAKSTPKTNTEFFGFIDTPTAQHHSTPNVNHTDGYDKREVDQKITVLDNQIYKLEQRIELLEKKLDVNRSNNNAGPMGW